MSKWHKPIPEARDRLQSKLLVWCVAAVLVLSAMYYVYNDAVYAHGLSRRHPFDIPNATWVRMIWQFLTPLVVSLTFGFIVWRTKAATLGGIFAGMLICYSIIHWVRIHDLPHSALVPVISLFLLTFAATKAGKRRKEVLGVSEDSHGRNAAQVFANLGVAGLIFGTPWYLLYDNHLGPTPWINHPWFEPLVWASSSMFLAALCEATADTVSSEIGQAFGGTPILLTSLRRVPPGTDGAVSLLGTGAGILAAALVALTTVWSTQIEWWEFFTGLTGGIAGLFFDSLLGATVERKGWLGNDLVNFLSTLFAALITLLLLLLLAPK